MARQAKDVYGKPFPAARPARDRHQSVSDAMRATAASPLAVFGGGVWLTKRLAMIYPFRRSDYGALEARAAMTASLAMSK